MNLETIKRINSFAGAFAFHLFDTHGYPKELFEKDLERMTFQDFFSVVGKHKDFTRSL